jgi:hypothetical protein
MKRVLNIAAIAAALTVLGGTAFSAGDKYALKVPDGLAFSEFKGYESWPVIAVSQAGDQIEVIVGNRTMINAYQDGVPGDGKHFPDGAKMAKIHWKAAKSQEAPAPTLISGALHDVDFMVKDALRFPKSGGWGYAEFDYDAASAAFKPVGTGSDCGHACHSIVAGKDYVFTGYAKR